jgi:hypothetical protein
MEKCCKVETPRVNLGSHSLETTVAETMRAQHNGRVPALIATGNPGVTHARLSQCDAHTRGCIIPGRKGRPWGASFLTIAWHTAAPRSPSARTYASKPNRRAALAGTGVIRTHPDFVAKGRFFPSSHPRDGVPLTAQAPPYSL